VGLLRGEKVKFLKKLINKHRINRNKIEISQSKLVDLLNEQLPEHKLLPLDGKYQIPHIDDLEKAIDETVIDEIDWVKNTFDCDDISMHFHSILALEYSYNGCGIVLSFASKHAFNILISHRGSRYNLQVHVFEPQSDKMWTPNIKKDKYIIKDQTILI